MTYLLVRDGWFALLAQNIASRTPSFGPPTRLYRFLPSPHVQSISPELQRHIDNRITQLLRGPVHMRDHALLYDGALVDKLLTSQPTRLASVALSDDNRIGNCWLIPATHGQLGIALPYFIIPTSVTVDHIPIELAATPGHAPCQLVLWGVIDDERNKQLYLDHLDDLKTDPDGPPQKGSDDAHFVALANFTYNIKDPSHVQTFPVRPVFNKLGMDFGVVVLEIVDNWGAGSTCLYRVRIHGETSSVPV